MMKKILLISAGLILLVVISVPALFFIYKEKIKLKAEREINKNINGSLTFEDVSISIFKDFPNLTLTLENVVVEGKGIFLADTLARIDELDIEVKTSSLLSGNTIDVKSTHLLRPTLYFETLNNGQANYENIMLPAPAQKTVTADTTAQVNISLDRISVEEGVVIYEDKSMGLFSEMRGLNYTGSGDFGKNIFDLETKTKIKEFTLDYGDIRYCSKKHVSIDMILEINLKENKFTFKENDIRVNHFKFSVDGAFSLLDDGYDMDLKFKTREASFKTILSLVPGLYMDDFKQIATAGEMQFDGYIKGKYSDKSIPAFLTNVKISDAMFKLDSLPDPVENIQMDLTVKNEYGIADSMVFDLRNFHMDMRKHPIHGSVKIKGYPHYIVDADVFADLDLAELEKMYPIKGIELKGKLNAELKANGQYIAATSSAHKDSTQMDLPKQLPAFHINLKLADGKIKYDHLPKAIENIQVHMTADNTTGKLENTVVDIKGFHLDMDKNPVHGYLKVSGFTNYVIDTDIKATVDLADLEKMYPIENFIMKGLLDLDIEANGTYNQIAKKFPMVDAKFNLTNGYLKSSDYPEPVENIHLITEAVNKSGKLADTRVTINKLTYTLEKEPFDVSGSISDLEDYNYDLKIKGLVDLEKVTKIYPIQGMKLKGEIDTDIEARGTLADIEKGRYDKLKNDGSVEIKNFEMKSKDIPNTIKISDALFTFTPLKIVLERFTGKFGKSNVTMTGDLTDYMAFVSRNDDLIVGDMKVKCDTLDLNEWYIPTTQITTKTVQKTAATPPQPKTAWRVPANINFTFDSDINVVKYQDMNISDLDGEIKIKDEALTLHETGFNSLDAKFNLSGDYDTKDINHPQFDFELDIKELDINKAYKEIKLVRDMAPAAGNTYGELSITYKLQGELTPDMTPKTETLVGAGEIHIANAKINGMKIFEEISKTAKKEDINDPHLKDFYMKTEIHDNKIFVKPFDIKISGLNAEIEGVSEISGAISYVVKIELLPIEKLRIPFHVSGTYDNPKVAIGKGHSLPD